MINEDEIKNMMYRVRKNIENIFDDNFLEKFFEEKYQDKLLIKEKLKDLNDFMEKEANKLDEVFKPQSDNFKELNEFKKILVEMQSNIFLRFLEEKLFEETIEELNDIKKERSS